MPTHISRICQRTFQEYANAHFMNMPMHIPRLVPMHKTCQCKSQKGFWRAQHNCCISAAKKAFDQILSLHRFNPILNPIFTLWQTFTVRVLIHQLSRNSWRSSKPKERKSSLWEAIMSFFTFLLSLFDDWSLGLGPVRLHENYYQLNFLLRCRHKNLL